jgi:hypothetical protein
MLDFVLGAEMGGTYRTVVNRGSLTYKDHFAYHRRVADRHVSMVSILVYVVVTYLERKEEVYDRHGGENTLDEEGPHGRNHDPCLYPYHCPCLYHKTYPCLCPVRLSNP